MKNQLHIRSFVRRAGRVTTRQQRALDQLWPVYGIDINEDLLNFVQIFSNQNPVILEIGFGMGQSLLEIAKQHPEQNFIGIEVHSSGVGNLLASLAEENVTNVRVISIDAVEVFSRVIADASLHGIMIFFPDPWHKKKHHKRRLIQSEFVQLLTGKLIHQGQLHLATDWQDYAEQMMRVLSDNRQLINQAGVDQYLPRPSYRPLTKFELRGQRLGHQIWDLLFIKQN